MTPLVHLFPVMGHILDLRRCGAQVRDGHSSSGFMRYLVTYPAEFLLCMGLFSIF
jgi:hypothetical protein